MAISKEIDSLSFKYENSVSKLTGHPLEQSNTQRNSTAISTSYTPRSFSMKNRYYDRKVRESLEIEMPVVRYGQGKVLKRDNRNFVETNAWKPLFRKMKTLH